MISKEIIFVIFAVITVGSAALVVFSKKIIYAAFSLMLSLFGVAALFVFLSADFLAAVQIIIYVGGILVLILFGVLLTVKITSVNVTSHLSQRIWGTIAAIGMFVLIFIAITGTPWETLDNAGEVLYYPQSEAIGVQLLTNYILPFEVASILLLAALIGAMFLVRSEKK